MDGDYLFDWLKRISIFFFFWVMKMMNILLASLSVFPAASHAKWCLRKFWKSGHWKEFGAREQTAALLYPHSLLWDQTNSGVASLKYKIILNCCISFLEAGLDSWKAASLKVQHVSIKQTAVNNKRATSAQVGNLKCWPVVSRHYQQY